MTSPNNDIEGSNDGCPICGAQSVKDYAPFCSKRCADVDLHRWLTEGYAIPAQEDESDGAPEEPDEA